MWQYLDPAFAFGLNQFPQTCTKNVLIMNKRILLLWGLLFGTNLLLACDVCGCSANGYGAGLLSAYRYNTMSVRWFYSPFEQVLNQGIPTKDGFNRVDFNLRYHIRGRWIGSLVQPYQWNHRMGPDRSFTLDGLGDFRFTLSYVLLDNILIGEKGQLYWEYGAGLKAPTGKFDDDIHQSRLPENFNIGNGSWASLWQTSILYNWSQFGWATNMAYQLNGRTEEDYHFGNQLSLSSMCFVRQSLSESAELIPFAGIFYEKIHQDLFYEDNAAHATGGEGYYLTAGLNTKYRDFLLGCSIFTPFQQNYAEGEMQAKTRLTLELTYAF